MVSDRADTQDTTQTSHTDNCPQQFGFNRVTIRFPNQVSSVTQERPIVLVSAALYVRAIVPPCVTLQQLILITPAFQVTRRFLRTGRYYHRHKTDIRARPRKAAPTPAQGHDFMRASKNMPAKIMTCDHEFRQQKLASKNHDTNLFV